MYKILLLSGGIDSTSLAKLCIPDIAVFVDYGQFPSKGENRASEAITKALNIKLHKINIDCSAIGSGLLFGKNDLQISPSIEWQPFRNQLLATIVGAWAVQKHNAELIIGSVKSDNFHVDATESFYKSLDSLMSMQEGNIRIKTPAINMTSEELVETSGITDEILGWTHSCHTSEWACGECPGCHKRRLILKRLQRL